MFSRFASLR